MAVQPVVITGEQVRELISMSEVIDAVENGLKCFSAREVVQPVRSVVEVQEHKGFLGLMPAYCYSQNCLATKIITLFPNNTDVPTHQAVVVQLDPTSGSVIAIIDGVTITNMRTAAASAVALKYVKLSGGPPRILTVVGCGVQARSHVEALRVICQFDEIRIWGRDSDKAAKCASDVGGGNVSVWKDLQAACKDADVIVTVTMATEPILKGAWLKEGTIVLAVGACRPDWRELDSNLMEHALIIVDSREAALKESGDIILAKVDVHSEVGELVAMGSVTTETMHSLGKKFVVFKSLGVAIEDAVTGKLIYDKYLERNKT
jgi:thiomorpholine-carboxylate dehydrogenase